MKKIKWQTRMMLMMFFALVLCPLQYPQSIALIDQSSNTSNFVVGSFVKSAPTKSENIISTVAYATEEHNQVILSAPINGEKIFTTSPKLSWLSKTTSKEMVYELEYATSEDMSDGIKVLCLTSTQIILDGLEPSTKYFWRVRSSNGNNYSEYSQVESFETGSTDFQFGTE